MRRISVMLCTALVLGAFAFGRACADEPVPAAKIDADMRAAIARHETAGIVIAILRDGNVVFEHAYGQRNAADGAPVDMTTQFEIGSITKQFTAAAVMQLVEAGKVSLSAPLATYLPNAPHASEVTIRELLSHTSGLPNYLPDIMPEAARPATFDQLIARIAGKPLDFVPGTHWEYSNTNYLLLGRVIEVVSGEPYERYLFDRVLAKAPGANFATIADESRLPDMASGYLQGKPAPVLDNSWAGPAGNLVGTVGDMIAWDTALTSGQVVSQASYAAMTTVQTPPGAQMPYGFGFIIDRYDDQPRIWHNGGTYGFNATDQLYPNQQTRIIVFTNDVASGADRLGQRIFDDLYPSLAAAAQKPASGEDPAFTLKVRHMFENMLAGKIDRSQWNSQVGPQFTDAVVAQVAAALKPLGAPQSYVFRGCTMAGNVRACQYIVTFPAGRLLITVASDPDGKFSGFYYKPQ